MRHSFEEEQFVPNEADIWIHLAWAGAGSQNRTNTGIQEYNVRMSLDALEKAAEIGCKRFVFSGSQAEYGGIHNESGYQTETDECFPVSEYGKYKLLFGSLAAQREYVDDGAKRGMISKKEGVVEFVHLRIFSVYGPGDHPWTLVNTAVDGFLAGRDVTFGPCCQIWNYMYIDDAADAIIRAALYAKPGIINIGSFLSRPLKEYVEVIKKICGKDSELFFGARKDNAEGAAGLCPDVRRLESTGFRETVSFEEGIKRIVEYKTAGF